MPVGVVCGKKELMHRFDPVHPLRVNYVIGTFAAAPITLGAMAEFLKWQVGFSIPILPCINLLGILGTRDISVYGNLNLITPPMSDCLGL